MNFIGLDLGQSNDYTAMAVLEAVTDKEAGRIYYIRRLERTRGTSYPDIVDKVAVLMRSPILKAPIALVVDETGVGRPVVDLLQKSGLRPISIFIHGGDKVSHEGDSWRVPKRDLVGVIKILLQKGRLEMSDQLKLGSTLQQEMMNFNYKLNPLTAHDSYGCWREGQHDDLTLAVALAAWWGESRPKAQPRLMIQRGEAVTPSYRVASYSQHPFTPHY